MKQRIPLFFSCDANYLPYLGVAVKSLIEHANKDVIYDVNILHVDMTKEDETKLANLERDNIKLHFYSLKEKLEKISKKLDDVRDYYTQTIFYRLFIAEMFKDLKKAIYLDCDIIILSDLVELYNTDLGDNILGCVVDNVVANNQDFKIYVKDTLDVEPQDYFNSGVLLINLDAYRKYKVEEAFFDMINDYAFKSVAPDQDFLNFVCKNKKVMLEEKWNRMPINDNYNKEINIIHYNMFMKPWTYDGVRYEEKFWEFANKTDFYSFIIDVKKNYSDEQRKNDLEGVKRVVAMCYDIMESKHTYRNKFSKYIA